jgi:hypothetical protein
VSESEQNPPESDFYSEYYRDRPPRERSRPPRKAPAGLAALEERAKGWFQGGGAFGQMRVRIGALVAVAIAAGFIIWAAVGGGGGTKSSPPPPVANAGPSTGPVALSASGLRTLGATLKQPIYWLGARSGGLYELRQLSNGNVYMRYLPSGAKAGDSSPLLTVGTYPMSNAFSIVKDLASKPGATSFPVNGGVGFYTNGNPRDAYLAFSGSDYQIEVYSPTPGVARRLAQSGDVKAVPGTGAALPGVTSTTPAQLRSLAKNLAQPIFWAGRQPGVTYEIRQTSAGIYLRYLPKGVAVGDSGAYRTIATYPLSNAYDATLRLSQSSQKTTLKLPGGGVAALDKQANSTSSVYVAFQGSPYQVEVFDPQPGAARRLVASKRITAVG